MHTLELLVLALKGEWLLSDGLEDQVSLAGAGPGALTMFKPLQPIQT